MSLSNNKILVIDFGSQYTHLILRRLRELGVYCELLPYTFSKQELVDFSPSGVILSGGPNSCLSQDSPRISDFLLEYSQEKRMPLLGICYGMQSLMYQLGGKIKVGTTAEYGKTNMNITASSLLFENIPDLDQSFEVVMSHLDHVTSLPNNFHSVAETNLIPFAAVVNDDNHWYGLQFHPEVYHTKNGVQILENFVSLICQCPLYSFQMQDYLSLLIQEIKDQVKDSHVIGAMSGGVDSTVASVLMHRAIGNRYHPVLVDNGFLRTNEAQEVKKVMKDQLDINLEVVYAQDLFFDRLSGITEPEQKRKIIGHTFIEIFDRESRIIRENIIGSDSLEFLLQGTIYPDVIESKSVKVLRPGDPSSDDEPDLSDVIKTHHNVGGLPDNMHLKLVEPLRMLFKDEVRKLGKQLGIPDYLVYRHPFPGPGLGIRVIGEVTPDKVKTLQHADKIYLEELHQAGIYNKISQAGANYLPIDSVGVMGDKRTVGNVISLRAVVTTDFMTVDPYRMDWDILFKISRRIINEVDGVNRVYYDCSPKPGASTEIQ